MRTVVAWLITIVWAAGYVRKLIDPAFPVPAEITPVMLLAAGYLFGKDAAEKLRKRINRALDEPEEDDKDDPKPKSGRGRSPRR